MKRIRLVREHMNDQGTFGRLAVDGRVFVTGELPWRDNRRGKSCVPAGSYIVLWEPSGKYGRKYELQAVPGRDHILIHAANHVGDEDKGLKAEVDGCISLGLQHGFLNAQKAVIGSRNAVADFEQMMGHAPFELEIVDAWREAGDVTQAPARPA